MALSVLGKRLNWKIISNEFMSMDIIDHFYTFQENHVAQITKPVVITDSIKAKSTINKIPLPQRKFVKSGIHYFEFKDQTSNKFWEVQTKEENLIVRFGKIGTNGQKKTKTFKTAEQAQKELVKLVKDKTGKGYKLIK